MTTKPTRRQLDLVRSAQAQRPSAAVLAALDARFDAAAQAKIDHAWANQMRAARMVAALEKPNEQ